MRLWIFQGIIYQLVAFIPELGDFARFDCLFDSTIRLVSMTAAGKPA